MRTFFKIFFACLLALFVGGFITFLVLAGIIGSLANQEDTPTLSANTILHIDLSKPVTDQGKEMDFDFLNLSSDAVLSLQDVVNAIEHAATDTAVKAIYLKGRYSSLGLAGTQEVKMALATFKDSGKPIVAFAEFMTLRAYEVCHLATHLYLQPGGMFEWAGYNLELMFFKKALDKLAIKPEIFYAGQFKSATEPFRLTKMTDANRLQLTAFLNSMYGQMLSSVQKNRGVDSATLVQLANQLKARTAEQALAQGLIDGTLYDNEVKDTLKALAGTNRKGDLNLMDIADYKKTISKSSSGDKIALVYAVGDIMDGDIDEEEVISGDRYRALLRRLRTDDRIKAVVLRVNSPGGSALASETIWKELQLLKAEKPLVVSMGDYAASGGYYMSAIADTIFATPNTITGSIGVFSMYFDAQRMLNDKLGLTFDGVSTGQYADFGNVARPMSAFEKTVAQAEVDTIYTLFKKRVADGRKMRLTQVDSVAQGRIWSGTEALQVGLVDKLGNLNDAIACAARMAGSDKYYVRTYPKVLTLLDKLMEKKDPNTADLQMAKKVLGPGYFGWLQAFTGLKRMANTPQAKLPLQLKVVQPFEP